MRLFVAIEIPEDVRRSLAAWVARLRNSGGSSRTSRAGGPRWTRIEGLHLTLKFIGEAPEDRLVGIRAALAAIHRGSAIDLRFRNTGFFPNEKQPRVFWAGIESGPELQSLVESVERQLVPLGFPREARAFQPHLTLARFPSAEGLDQLREQLASAAPAEFGASRAREFHLYQSVLRPDGAVHTRVASFDFAGGGSR
jgi:RNA 2',3'-cyclic 3'-phosphodiesterase